MSRWTQTWLSAPWLTGGTQEYRGQRLGLPRSGAGSAAGLGVRAGALLIDWLPASILAQVLTENPGFSALVLFAVLRVLTVGTIGRSIGHSVLGIRVARLDGRPAGPGPAVLRTVLTCLVVPPLVYNSDGRGLHDRAAGTVVLRTR